LPRRIKKKIKNKSEKWEKSAPTFLYDKRKKGSEKVTKLIIPLDKPMTRVSVPVKAGDTKSRVLHFTLTNNGTVIELDKIKIAAIKGIKPDGTKIFNTCVIKDNEVLYEITNQTIAVPGTVECELKLYGMDGESVTTAKFQIEAYSELFADDYIESMDEFNIISVLIGSSGIIKEIQEHIKNENIHLTEGSEKYQEVCNKIEDIESELGDIGAVIDKITELI